MVDTLPPTVRIPAVIEQAIAAQQKRLFDAEAIIEVTIAALHQHFSSDWPGTVPMFDRALMQALDTIKSVAGELESANLEQATAKAVTNE